MDRKTVSSALGRSTIAVTANDYLHAVENLERGAAARIGEMLGQAVKDGLAALTPWAPRTSVPNGIPEQQKTP